MKTARFVLAGLAAVTILLGDCTESEARGRLFGRRHRTSCTPCPSPRGGEPTDDTWICPRQQTPYYAGQSGGVDYYMFYAQQYYPNGNYCGGMPQPAYLPAGSPIACGAGAPCWNPSKRLVGDQPPNLADYGHEMTEGQLLGLGEPDAQYQIDFGPVGTPDLRNINFYKIWIWEQRRYVWTGLENPFATAAYRAPPPGHAKGDWNTHRHGKTVTFNSEGRPYFVVMKKPSMP